MLRRLEVKVGSKHKVPPLRFAPVGMTELGGDVAAHSTVTSNQNTFLKVQNRKPASIIEMGRVRTQAMARLRTVDHCRPEWLAAMVPAMPDESTCVVLTGRPYQSASPMVNMAVISAAAPCP